MTSKPTATEAPSAMAPECLLRVCSAANESFVVITLCVVDDDNSGDLTAFRADVTESVDVFAPGTIILRRRGIMRPADDVAGVTARSGLDVLVGDVTSDVEDALGCCCEAVVRVVD